MSLLLFEYEKGDIVLKSAPSEEMIKKWKSMYAENRKKLTANRKTGYELEVYFREKYNPQKIESIDFENAVIFNITENQANKEKLPEGAEPQIVTYQRGNTLVGIDLITGFFQVESEDIREAEKIYNDLFAFRGLDEKDLENFFLVAQYIELT